MTRTTGYNSTYKKLAVQCLNETLYFVSSSVLADSFDLLIRHYRQRYENQNSIKMKSKKITFITSLLFFIITSYSNAQNEPYVFVFNSINYFAPADRHFSSVNKTTYDKTEITIDFSTNKILLKTYYSDGLVDSTYEIKKVSELQTDYNKGNFYVFTCRASNNAEAIFEVSKEGRFITRKITHNGIIHKYFNR